MYRVGEKSEQHQDTRNSGVLRSWIDRWVNGSYQNFDKIEKELFRNKKSFEKYKEVAAKIEAIKKTELSNADMQKAIMEADQEKYGDFSLVSHVQKHKGEPAIIVGAGISLEKLVPYLKNWKGVIFAPESMASTLKYLGHQPEYICLFDCALRSWDAWFKGYNWKGSTLVTHPSADPEVIERWKQKRIYYIMMHYARLAAMPETEGKKLHEVERAVKEQLLGFDFFENILPITYHFIGAAILNAGCVVNNAIEVANFMGFGPIFLCGIDYGFKDWILRYPQSKKVKGKWVHSQIETVMHEEGKNIVGDAPCGREIIISDNGIPTTDEQSEYKLALMSVYKLDRPQLFDCSDGIVTELPKVDIKEVIEKNGRGFEDRYRTDAEIIRIANSYFDRR